MTVKNCTISEKSLATVEFALDAASIEAEKAKAFKKQASKFNIPGFRRGKAPRSIIEKMYGTGVFLEDAVNALITASYDEILNAPGREVVSRPEFDMVSMEENGDVVMKAEMYVKPEVKIADYKGIKVSVVKAPVTDEEVDAEISGVRNRNARELDVEGRAAAMDDTADIDFEGFIDGVAFEGGKGEGHKLKLGSGQFIPGFEEQIVGKNPGDEFDVNVSFPEDYHAAELAGKPAVFKVKLNKLTYEELPELNDDFAVEVSEFNTFAEYREDLVKKIEKRHADAAEADLNEKIDTVLAEKLDAEIPESMIDNEVEAMVRDTESRISMNGLDFKTYLSYFGMTLDQYKENARPSATTAVKSRLALEKIAEEEKIEVTDEEVDNEYAAVASQYNVELDYAKENLPREDVVNTLRLRAAMAAVKAAAEVEYLDKEPEADAPKAEEKPKKKRTTKKKAEEDNAEDKN